MFTFLASLPWDLWIVIAIAGTTLSKLDGYPSNLESVVPAIAITIHKSQGSEAKKVNILWSQNYRRNQYAVKEKKDNQNIFCRDNFERRLFYTAVTRAKKFLDIYYLN